MAERDLKLVIRAADEFSATLKKYSSSIEGIASDTSTSVGKIRGPLDTLKSHWLGVTAVIVTAAVTLKKAYDFAETAAQFQQMERGFNNLAASHGADSEQIIANLRRMSGETVTTAAIMESAGKALLLGIPAEQLDDLMQIARSSAKVTGQTVQQAFNDIATGIGRQSKLILDNLGIIVSVGKAYEDYAQSVGKSASALTDAEKKQAFTNATIEAGQEIVERVGNTTETAAESIGRMQARFADLKIELSTQFLPVGVKVIEQLTEIGTAISEVVKGYEYSQTPLFKINEKITELRSQLKDLQENSALSSIISNETQLNIAKELNAALQERANLLKLEQQELIKTTQAAIAQQEAIRAAATGAGSSNDIGREYIFSRKMRESPEIIDPSQVWLNVPDYDAMAADAITREQNMVSDIVAAREEHQAQFATVKMDTPWLLTEEQLSAIQTQKEMMFDMESNYEDMLLDRHLSYSEQAMQIEKKLQQTKMNLQFGAANQAAALLSIIGQRNKAAAYAALAVQKGLAIAQVFINTKQAAALAMATVPPPAGEVLAASIETWGAVQMGLIAATGLAEAAMGGGGPSGVGGGGGVGALPITPPALSSEGGEDVKPTQEIIIQIYTLTGQIDGKAQEEIIRAINEAGDRNVKINAHAIASN